MSFHPDGPVEADLVTFGGDLTGTALISVNIVAAGMAPGAPPVAEVLGAVTDPERTAWAILTGPEGGLTRSELDGLDKLPFVSRAGLGPRTLRAETAGLAALACWQALLGDWRAGDDS